MATYFPPSVVTKDEGTLGASDVEEASNSEASSDRENLKAAAVGVNEKSVQRKRVGLMILAAVIIAVIVGCAVGLSTRDDNNDSQKSAAQGAPTIQNQDEVSVDGSAPVEPGESVSTSFLTSFPTSAPTTVFNSPESSPEGFEMTAEGKTTNFFDSIGQLELNEDKPFAPYSTWEEVSDDITASLQHYADFLIDFAATAIFQNQDYNDLGSSMFMLPFMDPYYLFGDNPAIFEIMNNQATTARTGDSSGSTNSKEKAERKIPDSFETNNQEAGVDEPDVVKSDGVYVYTAFGSDVYVIEAEGSKNISKISIPPIDSQDRTESGTEETTISMARSSDATGNTPNCEPRVMGMILTNQPSQLAIIATDICYKMDEDLYNVGYYMPFNVTNATTRVLMYDTSNPENLVITSEQAFGGLFHSARAVGSTIHVVTTTRLNLYQDLGLYGLPMLHSKMTEQEFRSAAQGVVAQNIPKAVQKFLAKAETMGLDPDNVLRATTIQSSHSDRRSLVQDATASLLVVSSFDVTSPNDVDSTALFLPGPTDPFMEVRPVLYMSTTKLIVAGYGFSVNDEGQVLVETYLIAANVAGKIVDSVSAAVVDGYVAGQLALDHHVKNDKDYLRVATISFADLALTFTDDGMMQTSNQVTVLEIPAADSADSTLKVVGVVEDIGVGEEIYAVRFNGDRGYVVTFLYIDPVHTLDLSDPENPKIAGILEITGYSAYLHEIGENLILGIGQDIHNVTGSEIGVQVSVYDVSDFENPVRVQNYVEEQNEYAYSSSYVTFNFKAFRYIEESNLLILPAKIEDYNTNEYFDGFYLYSVNATTGIEKLFSVNHHANDQYGYYYDEECWGEGSIYPRSLVIGGNVLTFKVDTLLNHNIETHEEAAAPFDFPKHDMDYTYNYEGCIPLYYVTGYGWF